MKGGERTIFGIILEGESNPVSYVSLLTNILAIFSFLKVLLDCCIIPSTGDKSCKDYHVSLFYHDNLKFILIL